MKCPLQLKCSSEILKVWYFGWNNIHHIKNHKTVNRGQMSFWYDLSKTPKEREIKYKYKLSVLLWFWAFVEKVVIHSYLQCGLWGVLLCERGERLDNDLL